MRRAKELKTLANLAPALEALFSDEDGSANKSKHLQPPGPLGGGLSCNGSPAAVKPVTPDVFGHRPVDAPYPAIMPKKNRLSFSFADWKVLTGPLVYAWVIPDGEGLRLFGQSRVQYVGMSINGFFRVTAPDHHVLNGAEKPWRNMRLLVWPMPSIEAAQQFERSLIWKHRPNHNHRDKPFPGPKAKLLGDKPLSAASRRLQWREMMRKSKETKNSQ
jgi:hypothetical protein